MAPAARQDAADRPREGPHHLRRGDQVRARRPGTPTRSGWPTPSSSSRTCKPVEPRALRSDVSLLDRQQAFGYTQEDTQAPDVADGDDRPGSRRLDGHRHADLGAVGQAEAALHLFQAELRPGHQPADRPDPRGTGDEPGLLHRAAAEHLRPRRPSRAQAARGAPADPDQCAISRRSARSATPRTASTPRRIDITYAAERGRRRHAGGARAAVRARRGGGRRRLQHHHPVRPPDRAGPHRRSRRCWRRRPSTIT